MWLANALPVPCRGPGPALGIRTGSSRPGLIKIGEEEKKKYFVEEGTVEFLNNSLLILTSTVKDLSNLNQSFIEDILVEAENKLKNENSSDKEKYLLSGTLEKTN